MFGDEAVPWLLTANEMDDQFFKITEKEEVQLYVYVTQLVQF